MPAWECWVWLRLQCMGSLIMNVMKFSRFVMTVSWKVRYMFWSLLVSISSGNFTERFATIWSAPHYHCSIFSFFFPPLSSTIYFHGNGWMTRAAFHAWSQWQKEKKKKKKEKENVFCCRGASNFPFMVVWREIAVRPYIQVSVLR